VVDGREVWGSGPVLPEDATEMSETEWQAGIDAARMQPPATLLQIKSALKVGIDAAAEAERLKYITPGHGQAMTYQQKVTEAQAFKATTNPQPSDYPILSSEVGITAETIGEVADVVLAAFAQWQQIGAMIESVRLGAKRDIDAAADEPAARTIFDAIEWPHPAL
ncbi:hypothetical protein, partial [Brucella anthropi]